MASPAFIAAMFSAINVTIIGLVIGEKTDEWMPKKNTVQIAKLSSKTAHGLSMLPTSGAKKRVRILGGSSPAKFRKANRPAINAPPVIKVTGISSNERETKSGTPSGIFNVR